MIASDDTVRSELTSLAALRPGGGQPVVIVLASGSPGEAVARARQDGQSEPLGVVAQTEAEAFAALAAGADDAATVRALDLQRFIAFLDRVSLRAEQRRASEIRQAVAAQAEKLAALGTVVAGVAHEINNPLGVVVLVTETVRSVLDPLLRAQEEIARLVARGTAATPAELNELAQIAETGSSASEVRASLDDVDSALQTITDVVRDLRIFARTDRDEQPEAVYLPDLIDHVLRVVGKQITSVATLERDYSPNLPALLLPRGRITQVLTNLLVNASQAVSAIDRPMHRVRISTRSDAEAIALSVSDSGPGIPPEIVERVFDPFFTTRRGEATPGAAGLGLSVSRSILQSIGGDLIVESVHGAGATFIAIIPTEGRTLPYRARRTLLEGGMTRSSARASVLVVDDEEALLRNLATSLRGRFDVLLASDGQEAIDLLVSGSKPDAILCDVVMPVADGGALYDWLLKNRRDLAQRTVFITADAEDPTVAAIAARAGRPLLEKPVSRERIVEMLERTIDVRPR